MLAYSLEDYRAAPSGEGPLKRQWRDKPHRLVYDLVGEVERLRADTQALSDRIAADYQEKADLRAALDAILALPDPVHEAAREMLLGWDTEPGFQDRLGPSMEALRAALDAAPESLISHTSPKQSDIPDGLVEEVADTIAGHLALDGIHPCPTAKSNHEWAERVARCALGRVWNERVARCALGRVWNDLEPLLVKRHGGEQALPDPVAEAMAAYPEGKVSAIHRRFTRDVIAELAALRKASREYLEATVHFPGVNWYGTTPGKAAANLRGALNLTKPCGTGDRERVWSDPASLVGQGSEG